ncbi:lysine-2,3-aminomutase-like protein [Peteryoungia ipomoeae]|uniref:Lysine-2,3-aminomutase-like protein n=1 Tax=Peteryoungia ipomoeae TaxID=1210932 RepID=A0A4S8NU95_9HYPH|nr:lysine-2,3-aminomutase-like protein [Peteryoungia ipomoeae]THV20285.1 lysine-2,3-aminomutase-like protein [Peteryoungia ipomoeae]
MADATLRSLGDLHAAKLISAEEVEGLASVAERYAIAVTPSMLDLIDRTDPADPIAAQFLPSASELIELPGERDDPIGDRPHTPVEGVVHRYPDRVLLKLLHVCPVYCRFCFRREMVGPEGDGTLTAEAIARAIDYIRADTRIWEVIFTGGDPLILSPRRLREVIEQLATIEHVRIIRFHSRVPAVDPARITPELVEALTSAGKTVYVALHANHPRELTSAVRDACRRMVDAGIVMVSQSVLLKGVNADASTLADLMRAFVEMRVKPYYLHHPDMAPGTGHFRLSIVEGQTILRELRKQISGLCIPHYILDLPGGHGKVELGHAALHEIEPNRYIILDRFDEKKIYPE